MRIDLKKKNKKCVISGCKKQNQTIFVLKHKICQVSKTLYDYFSTSYSNENFEKLGISYFVFLLTIVITSNLPAVLYTHTLYDLVLK